MIIGKNGSGKSTLLRLLDTQLSGDSCCVRYITPERGGQLIYEGSIEANRSQNINWLENVRRRNQWEHFRQSSVSEFRNLEILVLRAIEHEEKVRRSAFTFDDEIEKINLVLDRVKLLRSQRAGFDIQARDGERSTTAAELSSGESELISLAIEIVYFSYLCKADSYKDQENWLLLDEPDVHLHPDLQYRLMRLLAACMKNTRGRVVIATHSTTILSSLFDLAEDIRIGLKQMEERHVKFQSANQVWKSVLPVFGAHPLSNVFNERPPLIVEGEDDERIWQTAIRSSQGRISVFPCVAGSVQSMSEYEATANAVVKNVYEHAKAFSLRDGDGTLGDIGDLDVVVRFRLQCRNAENLILTDDVLHELGIDWEALKERMEKWIHDNPEHPQHKDASKLRDEGWDRRNNNLKNLRNVIVGVCGSTKPWEVAVGRAIARLPEMRFSSEHCLAKYLGDKLVEELELLKGAENRQSTTLADAID
ncbi:MAG: AAA family ATPase [Chloroflexi bacterium]|nr:AAA family ATPase [Chloroflexota bacterium]